jgi:hypothetical protein
MDVSVTAVAESFVLYPLAPLAGRRSGGRRSDLSAMSREIYIYINTIEVGSNAGNNCLKPASQFFLAIIREFS